MFKNWIYFISWICVSQMTCIDGIGAEFKWPLAADFPTAEVEKNETGGVSGSDLKRCRPSKDLDYDSILFPGTNSSYMDLPINPEDVTFDEISFSMLIEPLQPYTGVILHYTRTTKNGDIAELMVWMNGSNLIIDTLNASGAQFPSVVLPNLTIAGSVDFVPFGFSYDNKGEIKVAILDQDIIAATYTSWDHLLFSMPCLIRIGGWIPEATLAPSGSDVNFKGRITCLQIYTSIFKEKDFNAETSECLRDKWKIPPTSPPSGQSPTCSGDDARYVLNAEDNVPDTSESYMDVMTTNSKLQCAEKCSQKSACLSFSIESGIPRCRMFDTIMTSHLKHIPNSKYYVRLGSSNCYTC